MPWVVDPALERRRREVLDLLTLARAETLFMESFCEDLICEVSELVGGTQLGEKLVSDLRAAVYFTGDSKSCSDGARDEVRRISIETWQEDKNDYLS